MSGEKVLIVEDDPTLRRGLEDNFAARGYRVSTAPDGDTGLEAALAADPDLILLDIMLPGINGYEICRAVREEELDVPIIMLTAKGQEQDIVRGLDLGADDYVTKPFSIQELLARARAFLRRRTGERQEIHRFGDCSLDLVSRRLSRSGSEVELTPKEFALLEYLVGKAGRALTRDQILRNVWGTGVLVTTRSVDRCISTLRGKIEPDPRYPTYIQTIRDIGYRFEMPEAPADDASVGSIAKPATLVVGTRLGRYEIRGLLGRGGMSEVYRARDARLDREIALKVLPRSMVRNPELEARFQREARSVAALSHPNIVTLHDVGRDRGVIYAVTELLDGESLRAKLDREGGLGWREAVEIGAAVADGLAAAHAKGVIHRDIKPGNLFLPGDGAVKVLDFGLARLDDRLAEPAGEERTLSLVTQPGSVLGTVAYMSPEQVRGRSVDSRSDIFSLGCVVFQMLSGAPPFLRDSSAETMAAILADQPPPLSDDQAPPVLQRVVLHCLEKNPDQRYQSASDLAFAMRSLL